MRFGNCAEAIVLAGAQVFEWVAESWCHFTRGPPAVAWTETLSMERDNRRVTMYISKNASRMRQREAQNARNNRAEIVKALSHGQITRRDLYKWGLLTTGGVIALKNGLSPLARSAFAG